MGINESFFARVDRNGRITIPKKSVRDPLQIKTGDLLKITIEEVKPSGKK